MKYSIVVLFYGKWSLTHNRLYEFLVHIPSKDVEIILVDNGSDDEDAEIIDTGVAFWQKKLAKHTIRYRKIPENVGFGAGMNSGASMAKGDIVILYSNDVVCSGNFLVELQAEFDKDRNILLGNEVIWYDGGWNSFPSNGSRTIVPYINGYFIACTKQVWDSMDGFDPLYGKYTMEDVDISMQAQQLGYKLVALHSQNLRHLGAQTAGYTPERFEITKQNKQKFYEKWKVELEAK